MGRRYFLRRAGITSIELACTTLSIPRWRGIRIMAKDMIATAYDSGAFGRKERNCFALTQLISRERYGPSAKGLEITKSDRRVGGLRLLTRLQVRLPSHEEKLAT
jgi:hypothetical protein